MKIDSYFNELENLLKRLPLDEREDVINFYREYALEAGFTDYEEMVERFGSPKNLAAQIYAESATKEVSPDKSNECKLTKGLLFAIAGILTLPLSLPILIGIISLGFAFLVSLFAIVFAMGATLFALGGTGIALFIKSFTFLVPFRVFAWLKLLGGSLILISLTCIIGFLLYLLVKLIIRLSTLILTKLIKIRRRDE